MRKRCLSGSPIHAFSTKSRIGIATRNPASGVVFENELLDIRFDRKTLLGAAVDIGTTSLSLYLFDLDSGEFLGTARL